MHRLVILFLPFLLAHPALAQETVLLWPGGAPDAVGDADTDRPALIVYLPPKEKATGTGVVVCPGGGYGHLAMDHEGHQVAKWLNELGIAAFVLKYWHASASRQPTPLRDVQRALRLVRANAVEWGVEEGRLGVLGFSAGGHLAASAGVHFDWQDSSTDAVDRLSARPDFMVLVYPVVTTTETYMHRGSRDNLLGEAPADSLVQEMSIEKQVGPDTPPAFLIHTTADRAVPPENSVQLYLALRRAGVEAELHVFEQGPHGFGLAPDDLVLSTWPALCAGWLRVHGWL